MGRTRLLDDASAVGSGRVIKCGRGSDRHTVEALVTETGATVFSALQINLQGASGSRQQVEDFAKTGVHAGTALAIGSTATQISWGAFGFRIDNVNYTVALDASEALPIAHKIALSKYGVINVYMNAAGTITTMVPGLADAVSQVVAQSYALSAAGAVAAIEAAKLVVAPEGFVYIGRILIKNDATLWTAGTDDMTDASDVATAQFFPADSLFINLAEHTFSAAERTARAAMFHVVDKHITWVRLYIPVLTGTISVTAVHENEEKG